VPIFLFSLSDKIHVEAETEISLNAEGETEVELEYADLHYFLTDTTTLTAGKFLVPFGQFGPNIHPSWINRSPWTPGIYGSHGSSQAMEALLPILSDVGVAIQQTFVIGNHQKIFVDLYSTNGPGIEADEHEEDLAEEATEEDGHAELPELRSKLVVVTTIKIRRLVDAWLMPCCRVLRSALPITAPRMMTMKS
jgi:hypothetical protein